MRGRCASLPREVGGDAPGRSNVNRTPKSLKDAPISFHHASCAQMGSGLQIAKRVDHHPRSASGRLHLAHGASPFRQLRIAFNLPTGPSWTTAGLQPWRAPSALMPRHVFDSVAAGSPRWRLGVVERDCASFACGEEIPGHSRYRPSNGERCCCDCNHFLPGRHARQRCLL